MRITLLACFMVSLTFGSELVDQEKKWREERLESLKSETGWLNLAGLFWLEDGTYSFGSSPDADIVFPPHTSVAIAGEFQVEGERVTYKMARAQAAYLNGELKNEGVLTLNRHEPDHLTPDVLSYNNLRMFLIKRGELLGLRLRDLRSIFVREFKEIEYYPIRRKYVIKASLELFDMPKKVFVATAVGTETIIKSPGLLKFSFKGEKYQLLPLVSGEDEDTLFIMFTDKTSGISTYGAGRFLYAKRLPDGDFELNFNRSTNPPCAFTSFATCPLPPDENTLPFEVKAGEKIYKLSESH